MKKLSLLIVVALLITTISVSAQRVIVRLPADHEVNIEGRYYGNNDQVPNLSYGTYKVSLYQVSGGILGIGKKRTFVSSSQFQMRDNDVIIDTDRNGRLSVNDRGNNNNNTVYNQNRNRNGDYGNRERDNDNRDRDDDYRNRDRNNNGYGHHNNPGRGNKYGHHKHHNKKDKHYKKNKNDKYAYGKDDKYKRKN